MYTTNSPNIVGIDHIAVAVPDLQQAIAWLKNVLGFCLDEKRETYGKYSGMKSAVMRLGPVTIVLTEGIGKDSQTARFVEAAGPGVQHVAFLVESLHQTIEVMNRNGMEFSSPRLDSDGLSQIFSRRDPATGLMIEFIERQNFNGFRDENVQRLFDSLEEKEIF
jgi:4-hydroxyphenylpyruvate dioxygenase-like putative hemolysin